MNYKRIGRALVCLLLVCCLIVNVSPVKAEASGAAAAGTFLIAGVPASLAVGAVIVGLGVGVGVATDAFDGVVDGCVGSTPMGQYILDGVIDAVKYTDLYGNVKWLFPLSFLETIRNWLYTDDILADNVGPYTLDCVVAGKTYSIKSDYAFSAVHLYATYYSDALKSDRLCQEFLVSPGTSYNRIYRSVNGSAYAYFQGSDYRLQSNGFYCKSLSSSTSDNISHVWTVSGIDSINLGSFSSYSAAEAALYSYVYNIGSSVTDLDLNLGNTGSSSQNFSSAHSAWAANAITVPGTYTPSGEDEQYIPVGLPSGYNDLHTSTQEEVQSGVSVFTGIVFEEDSTTPTEPDDIPGAGAVTATLLERLFGGVQEKLDATYTSIQEIPDLIREFMADVKKGFEELPTKFAEWFSNIRTTLELLVSGQLTIGQLLSEFISPLVDAFKALLQSLFSPSADFIANKVNSLIAKYPYVNTFLGLGTDLKAYFLSLGTQPPIIYIDLGAATGSYYFGGRQAFIDLTWYSTYKPTMDAILGAFIWLWLAWRIFLTLPSIINGGSGAAGSIIRYSERSSKTPDGGADK